MPCDCSSRSISASVRTNSYSDAGAELPYLYLVAAGSLRLHTPSGMMDYVAGQYSISAIDTPSSGYALTFSENNDFMSPTMRFAVEDVLSVVVDIDGDLPQAILGGKVPAECMEKGSIRRRMRIVCACGAAGIYTMSADDSIQLRAYRLKTKSANARGVVL